MVIVVINFLYGSHRLAIGVASVFVTFCAGSFAQPLSADKPQAELAITSAQQVKILDKLKQARPELNYTDIESSPIAGLYKIKINGQIAFVSADGRYLVAGDMFEVAADNLINLQDQDRRETEVAFESERAKIIGAVAKSDMIIFSPEGETKGYVSIFTDIDCGFCRKLHSQMDSFLDRGIEIRYLAFPRAGVDSKSAQKLATVWCAKDRQLSMTQFKEGKNMPIEICANNPVADQYMLGQAAGINGTPALVLASGKLIPGAVSAEYLAREMGF
jgi:thiol:disulfide interchange protein DsbC